MTSDRRGFTMVEFVIVLLIGAMLTSMALKGFGNTTSAMSVEQARRAYSGIHSRARAVAIERGSVAEIYIDEDGDSVWIMLNGSQLQHRDFQAMMDVDIETSPSGTVKICITPRGFADADCNSFSTSALLEFNQGGQSRTLRILPLGQIVW